MEVSSLLLLPQVAYSWHPPWYSGEGATITIRLRVTCKQLSVLATLVIVFEKLFYHFQFENSELNVCLHYFSDWRCLVDSILQWWYIHPGAVIGIDTCLQAVCKETIPVVLSNWIKTC